jgi:hypothetical protein
VVQSFGQPDLLRDVEAAVPIEIGDGRVSRAIVQRNLDVLEHRVLGNQVE